MLEKNMESVPKSAEERTRSLNAGTKLTQPDVGEEIVISGMAGRFPDSDDIYAFRDNLYNKVDLVSDDDRRWKPTHPDIPQRTGKINLIDKFDAGFFGIHERQAHKMDPMCRMLLEKSFEAIIDAGVNPAELSGSNTGVYIGCCFSESEKTSFYENCGHQSYGITGCTRSMLAKRISYFFQFDGPSFVTDTACSSSLFALEHAYKAIRDGKCDQAIVGTSNLCLHPIVSLQFARLGVLSDDGACKSFDDFANGYARSEGVCAIFLQKSKDARRIYAQVIHSKTNCDGYKEQGITYPSGKIQKILLDEFYEECGVDPSSLSYVEAHGTGTKVGDPEELGTLHAVFCTNRTEPLLIGSVKSNIGHNEPASGLCSVVKVLLGMEAGYIPPNMHYSVPRVGITALETGAIKVVSEKTRWPHSVALAAINSFGFGGANSHLLLRWNEKKRDMPRKGFSNGDEITRLVCVSGRTKDAVDVLLNSIMEGEIDVEYIRLLHQVFGTEVANHSYRGYCILPTLGISSVKSIQHFNGNCNPLHFIFSGLDRSWPKIGKTLFAYPLFAATIQKIHSIMDPKMDVSITDVIVNYNSKSLVHQFVGTIAIQIGLGHILKHCQVEPDNIIGCSLGELTAAYFDGVLTLEETMLITYYTAKVIQEDIVGTHLLKSIKNIVPKPIKLGLKWIPNIKNLVSKNTVSAEYFSQALLNQLILAETNIIIPKNVVLLEIGGLHMDNIALSKESLNVVNLISANRQNGMYESLGRLYEMGFNPKLEALYPEVSFPVSRGTRMISPFIRWDYTKDWFTMFYKNQDNHKSGYRLFDISLRDTRWSFISGHVIDGRYLFPATGYLTLVWDTLAMMLGKTLSEMYVVFDNVKFIRAATVPSKASLKLITSIQKGSGLFEVSEGGTAIVTGRVYEGSSTEDNWTALPIPVPTSNDQSLLLYESDIYKELKIRGYNYSEQFRALKECDTSATCGMIHWTGNWITFMDNMLQMHILKEDTRNLYVPTSIQHLSINARKHITYANNIGKDPLIPVYLYDYTHIVRSGGIEICGLKASSIVRRKQVEPVLETYKFVANTNELSLEESVRVNIQLALENDYTNIIRPRVVDILTPTDERTSETTTSSSTDLIVRDEEPLILTVQTVFGDLPLIQAELIILSKRQGLEYGGITVEDRQISSEKDCFIVIGNNLLQNSKVFIQVLNSLKPNGFIMTRESIHNQLGVIENNLQIISDHIVGTERIIFLRKCIEVISRQTVIEITQNDNSFTWLSSLQKTLKNTDPNTSSIVLFAQNCTNSGILGLVNCLRREPNNAERIRCVLVSDKTAPAFDANLPFYAVQLARGLSINVYCSGKWGTYRHLRLMKGLLVRREHCYVNVTMRGDLSSLKWIEGSLSSSLALDTDTTLVYIYNSTINFRDVMTASGKITADMITRDRIAQDCVQGFEFAGRDKTGRRIMGMVQRAALATMICTESNLLWNIPDEWTLEDAATVPVVYCTVLYAFFTRANLRAGQSVLIHAGTGGVGQAAINIALQHGCTVFTTVGTEEKRTFIRANYPQISAAHIGNSRDTSFEQMVLRETGGRGVDVVLNSLAEEKLQASVRCVAAGGTFLEIGKFDLASDSPLRLELFARDATFHGIMLDAFFLSEPACQKTITALLVTAIENHSVKPLPRTTFKMTEIEQAFRYMATGKHIGKVVMTIREEEPFRTTIPKVQYFDALSRYFCNPKKVYIILGGLGGFGLELADWLVVRGAKNLVLTTRNGVKSGYQQLRLRTWISYGVTVEITQNDGSTSENCVQLITDSQKLGEIAAIFNLAVVLKDALFDNQSVEDYQISFAPKATTTAILDRVTRDLCPTLEQFVVFSSVSCGRGNAGQSNYGMANSIMERICEQRHRDGLPGLAIQWGAIGDVGLVAEHMANNQDELVIGGTLQQRVSSCLEVLDRLLRQSEPVVASMVVAEKKSSAGGAVNIVDAVVNMLGLRDLKTVSQHSTLPELGMDSMMAVEIKQTLEREYEIFLTPEDIRGMTFARLKELSVRKTDGSSNTEKVPQAVQHFFKFIATEELSNIPMVKMSNAIVGTKTPKVFLLPGIEGTSMMFDHLTQTLKAEIICFQFCNNVQETTIESITEKILPQIMDSLKDDRTFNIVAYSFGSLVALELVASLEKNGYCGNVIVIDGGVELMREMMKTQLQTESEEFLQTSLLCALMSSFIPYQTLIDIQLDVLKCSSYTDRIRLSYTKCPTDLPHSFGYIERLCISGYDRIKAVSLYKPRHAKFTTSIRLYRPTIPSVKQISEDYKLGEWCLSGKVEEVKYFEGNHSSILENDDMAREINKVLEIDESMDVDLKVTQGKIKDKQEETIFTNMISNMN